MSAHRCQKTRMEYVLADVRLNKYEYGAIGEIIHEIGKEKEILKQSKSKSGNQNNRAQAAFGMPIRGAANEIPAQEHA